jgi:hypothetical protein
MGHASAGQGDPKEATMSDRKHMISRLRLLLLAAAAAAVSLTAASAFAGRGVDRAGTSITGGKLWLSRYDGPEGAFDYATSLAVARNGSRLFVTGSSFGGATDYDYATVANDPASGVTLWTARYDGPANGSDSATSVAVSADGTKVFVTGSSFGGATGYDYATVAYAATSGAQLWIARYNGPARSYDSASSVAVSADGTKVFVTGSSTGGSGYHDYATIAYDAATGAQLWVARYDGPANTYDDATSLAVNVDGTKLIVFGTSYGSGTGPDYATVAYDAASGARLWRVRYNGPENGSDQASSLALSADGTRVVVTGSSSGATTAFDYATVAYQTATGARLWTARYSGPANGGDYANSLALSSDGLNVFVTGSSTGGSTGGADYATVAYDATSGAPLWVARYNGPADSYDNASSVAASSDGMKVFVTGSSTGQSTSYDYATVIYNATTGGALWTERYNGPASGEDYATALAVNPAGQKPALFVTGTSWGASSDFATLAYWVS